MLTMNENTLPAFKDLVFYEIYPNSYKDADGDGYGDLKGIISKLDEIKEMGFNAIWLNPIYDSPFRDGGYDVRDPYKVSPRYGTNEDLKELVQKCHENGIRLFLDLVPGHMSVTNKEFLRSAEGRPNEDYDLFIWNDNPWVLENGYRLISGCYDRYGCFMVNFFAHQPAINYGFNKIEYPSWQTSYKETSHGRHYLEGIMKFWLDYGIDGFRCDMADSLVKNDDEKRTGTIWEWQTIRKELAAEGYKDYYLTSEWSYPALALQAFDSDFVLDHISNFSHKLFRNTEEGNKKPLLKEFNTEVYREFLADLKERVKASKESKKYLSLISGNHDTTRIANYLSGNELKLAYLYILTMPGVPYIYYGDEIGMHADLTLPSAEGGYQRTGTRMPMRFDHTKNAGFSSSDHTFLPTNENDPTLEDQKNDPSSLYNVIKTLISIRKEDKDLRSDAFSLQEGIFGYKRGKDKVYINLLDDNQVFHQDKHYKVIFAIGDVHFERGDLVLGKKSGALIREER